MEYRHAIGRIAAVIDAAVERSFPGRRRVYIANSFAGTRQRRRRTVSLASGYPEVYDSAACEIHWTGSPEEAAAVIRGLSAGHRPGDETPVVVSLGGDGTHNHCLRAGMDAPDTVTFLRVPLGSGNDAGSTASLREFFEILNGSLRERFIPAVEVVRLGNPEAPVDAAFNIASVGIDAFITAMHDKWRTVLPGNTYRLLVNMAVLRYERLVNMGPSRLTLASENGTGEILDDGFRPRTLIAMGVSGGRTYGDHMRVLPGEENICVLGKANLFDKFRMKRLFYAGRHVEEPLTTMYRSEEIVLEYDGRLPLQMDGEALWLEKKDFPLRMRMLPKTVSIIDPE
ncbi:MAG: diacylglycerol kinase family protein [Alkalispirochaeta sp.]